MHKYLAWASKKYSIFISQLQDYLNLLVVKPAWLYIPHSIYIDNLVRLNVRNIQYHQDYVSLTILDGVKIFGPIKDDNFTCSKKDINRTVSIYSSIYDYELDAAAASLIHNIMYRYVTEFSSYPWKGCRTQNLVAGNTFIDIGAFRGYVTIKASRKVGTSGKIISVEPIDENISFIRKHIQANEVDNVELLHGFVAEESDSKLYAHSNQVNGVVKSNLPKDATELVTKRFQINYILGLIPKDATRVILSVTTNGNEKSILESAVKYFSDKFFHYEIHLPYIFNHNLNQEIESLVTQKKLIIVKKYPWISIYKI